ncbi:unnamed protein product [Rotaria sp. Silwood2]|nr:unnamed protein product [Rotaria sp. Silwood2]
MNNNTRSHLNLQEYPISDLLYCSPSHTHSNSHSVCQQSKTDLLSQQTSLIPMPTLQSISELAEEPKTCDRMAQLDIKSNLQLLREQEKVALQSIKKLTEEEMIHIDQWLSVLHKTYEDWEYPSSHRVFQAVTYFNDEQKLWYEQIKFEINNDWSCFCDRLKQHIQDRQKVQIHPPSMNHPLSDINEITIDGKFY